MILGLLTGCRVLDLSEGLAGGYASRLLTAAGADVVKVEPAGGDPLRRWSASGQDLRGRDGALFRFLHADQRLVTAADGVGVDLEDACAGVDIVVESGQLTLEMIERLRARHPHVSLVSISPFGRRGPWADRPATEFTLQAECGAMAGRGVPERAPLQAGGRLGEWITGTYAAVAAVACALGAVRSGHGEHADVSMLECMCSCLGGMLPLSASLGGVVRSGPARTRELPSIEPTADGYVGICCNTAQHFQDFLRMIGREDLVDDAELASFPGRWARRVEFDAAVHAWTESRSTDDIVELATLLRIPAAAVGEPGTVTRGEHVVAREIYAPHPDGDFVVPRAPFVVDGEAARPTRAFAVDHEPVSFGRRDDPSQPAAHPAGLPLPFAGLRVLDFTSFWAGPSATNLLAALGADVVHVESIQHPDGYRFITMRTTDLPDHWWERSVGFQSENWNKRGITLDLRQEEGLERFLDLVALADVVVENYAPRVLDNLGITAASICARNPEAVVLRMPAYGLTGPWRDRTAFASTMEAASGVAWMTGYPDGPPTTLRAPLDPASGMHAVFAVICALYEGAGSGRGHVIEVPMIECALNLAAELVIEHTAYGASLRRDGNRGPGAAPQGVYACLGEEQWLAIAVETDDQWRALHKALDDPAWAAEPAYDTAAGRRDAHDAIDVELTAWAAGVDVHEAVELLVGHGVPAAEVVDGLTLLANPQLRFRGYFEPIDSPLLGRHDVRSLPFRFSSRAEPWIRRPAPTLGEHTREVLAELLGLDDDALDRLEALEVIGTRPKGV